MAEIAADITSRAELARLWLPWCVDARNPHAPLAHFPARHPYAAQLRMTDLDEDVIRGALAKQQTPSGETSWAKIEAFATHWRSASARGLRVVVDRRPPDPPTLMSFDDFAMLAEGCHRACALWVARVPSFVLQAVSSVAIWHDYSNPALRRGGRPFTREAE
jgi:hypothetical protein